MDSKRIFVDKITNETLYFLIDIWNSKLKDYENQDRHVKIHEEDLFGNNVSDAYEGGKEDGEYLSLYSVFTRMIHGISDEQISMVLMPMLEDGESFWRWKRIEVEESEGERINSEDRSKSVVFKHYVLDTHTNKYFKYEVDNSSNGDEFLHSCEVELEEKEVIVKRYWSE